MELSSRRRMFVTIGVLTGMLLAALEATVVATAMPTIVANLGGLAIYSWVFSIYLLTSTVTMPIWGKLSDLYGRRLIYQIGIIMFLCGSALSGAAHSMEQLIAFRAIQGVGAGALVPLALTIIGEIYTLQERARMQGVFSSVWGLASIGGPLLGGYITDHHSWRWIFYLNLPFGLLATVIMGLSMPPHKRGDKRPTIDFAGSATLIGAITFLMLGCLESNQRNAGWLSVGALVLAVIFMRLFLQAEQRAPEPLMPMWLFKEKLFLASTLGNLLAGCALYGVMSFLPLYMQTVLGSSATKAGAPVMLLLLGWVSFSFIGGRLLLRFGYRPLVIVGMASLALGLILLAITAASHSYLFLFISVGIVGMGMGFSMFSLLIAVQNSVETNQLGVVTSSTQFFRNIGGAVGTAMMGTLMSIGLRHSLTVMNTAVEGAQVNRDLIKIVENPNLIMDASARATLLPAAIDHFRVALASGIHWVFIFSALIGLLAFASSLMVPAGRALDRRGKEATLEPHTAD